MKICDSNVWSFLWHLHTMGRKCFCVGCRFVNAGPVYKSHYEWNRSNCLTQRTWFRKYWLFTWWRYPFSHAVWSCYKPVDLLLIVISCISSFFPAEGQQPLHLFLSSNNLKSLEDARLLAEHLLDTISVECGVSR